MNVLFNESEIIDQMFSEHATKGSIRDISLNIKTIQADIQQMESLVGSTEGAMELLSKIALGLENVRVEIKKMDVVHE